MAQRKQHSLLETAITTTWQRQDTANFPETHVNEHELLYSALHTELAVVASYPLRLLSGYTQLTDRTRCRSPGTKRAVMRVPTAEVASHPTRGRHCLSTVQGNYTVISQQ